MSDFTEDVDWYDGDDFDGMAALDKEAIKYSYSYWKTKNSTVIRIEDMDNSHLSNTIKYLEDVCMGNRPTHLTSTDRIIYLMNMKIELMRRKLVEISEGNK